MGAITSSSRRHEQKAYVHCCDGGRPAISRPFTASAIFLASGIHRLLADWLDEEVEARELRGQSVGFLTGHN